MRTWLRSVLFLVYAWPGVVPAVDGISVTGHWSGTNENLYGGYGRIVRHDIIDSQVVSHTVLYQNASNPARNPVISPDGSRVAFLLQDGSIAVVPVDGGQATVLGSAQSHGEACLDWPAGDWIYYTKGGFNQPSGSKLLHRVDAATDSDQYVLTFKKDDGTTDCGTWRFHIAADLARAAVRPDDTNPHPAGCITAFDLVADDRLRSDRSLGAVGDYRCSTGMDPEGTYFSEGNREHTGVTIRRWDDLSPVKTILWEDARWWGPDTSDTGISHNRNAWSANSPKWICIHVGWGTRGARGANQMLINWEDEQRIVVTGNTDGSYEFDCAGDFLVTSAGEQPPVITGQPQDITVEPGEQAAFQVTASGTPPLSYQWSRDGATIDGATAASYQLTAAPQDNGARFGCRVENAYGTADSDEALLTVISDTDPPTIAAVSAPGDPNTVWVSFSEPVEQITAEAASNYTIDNGIDVQSASLQPDPAVVRLATNQLAGGVTYTLAVSNVTDRADPPNPIAPGSTFQFSYEDQNQPPVVDAGSDARVRVGDDLLLQATVDDDGLPGGGLVVAWSKQSGPGTVVFDPPDQASTYARFDTQGDYVVRLTADDGDATGHDDIAVEVTPLPSISLQSPAGGESWEAGSTQAIRWTTVEVTNIAIDYSTDGGQTWRSISESVDASEDADVWGDFPWMVPNDPTDQAIVQLTVYSDPHNSTRSGPFTIVGGGAPEIHLLTPAGGESLTGGTTFSITWEAIDVEAVVLESSLDDGAGWEGIAMVDNSMGAWLDYTWTVPNVVTDMARIRVRTPGGAASDTSGAFSIEPAKTEQGELEVARVRFLGQVPAGIGPLQTVTVAGREVQVDPDGRFEASVELPAGATTASFAIEGGGLRRLVRIESDDAIAGLGVSAAELRAFTGGRGGVLVWVDKGGALQVLDFRDDAPQVRRLSQESNCINPIISPDGTRVVYSQGQANGPKFIHTRFLDEGPAELVGTGDVGYWHRAASGDEFVVYCDWSEKNDNGAGGNTYRQKLETDGIAPEGEAEILCDRAMDAGPDRGLVWLGQVYGNLWARNLATGTDYPTGSFFLMDGSPADHQTCNGSMAPDDSGRLMCLVIPHDFVRIFSYQEENDSFRQTSELRLPAGMAEWEFPEWSTDPGYFTAVLRASDLENRLFIGKVTEGDLVPALLEISGEQTGMTYSHLYLEP